MPPASDATRMNLCATRFDAGKRSTEVEKKAARAARFGIVNEKEVRTSQEKTKLARSGTPKPFELLKQSRAARFGIPIVDTKEKCIPNVGTKEKCFDREISVAYSHGPSKRRRRRSPSPSNVRPQCSKRICFFGDSFIRKFGLVKHQSIDIQGYKGATAKGLTRADNQNRKHCVKVIQNRPNAERFVFNFGNVDVHLSHYYCLYGKIKEETLNLKVIAEEYVDFVASLSLPSSTSEVIILGVYPSAAEDRFVQKSLVSYGSLTEEEVAKIPSEDVSLSARRKRVEDFNCALRQRCKFHNIGYADAVEEMTDPQTGRLREAFRDVSDHNIHVVWETTILLWMRRWPWYSRLAPRGFEEDMERTLAAYLKTKPWAERTQIAEKIGVHAALNLENNYNESYQAQTATNRKRKRNKLA